MFPFSARGIVCGLYSVQAVESPVIDGLLANGFACLDKYGSSTQFWFGLSVSVQCRCVSQGKGTRMERLKHVRDENSRKGCLFLRFLRLRIHTE